MKRLIAVLAVAILAAGTTHLVGQAPPRPLNPNQFLALGAGNTDCGKMTNNLRTDRQFWGDLYTYYAQGFLTGANGLNPVNRIVGQDTSPEALLAAMEQYCGQHPLEKVGPALKSVYDQLAGKL